MSAAKPEPCDSAGDDPTTDADEDEGERGLGSDGGVAFDESSLEPHHNQQPPHAQAQQQQTQGKRKDAKVCRVCGDKALGFNFDAISCESCKAFFRRNALKSDIPPCMFAKDCSITVATRRFCTFCRRQKCIQVGMRPELVNADEVRGKKARRESIIPPAPLSQPATQPQLQPQVPQQLHLHPQPPLEQSSPVAVHQQHELLQQSKEPLAPAIVLPPAGDQVVLNPQLQASGSSRALTREQWLAVSDLRQAYEQSFSDTSEDATPAGCHNLNTLVNSSCFIVKKLILFAKKLPDFIGLGQTCQIALLKGAVIGTLFLRSAVHYNRERDVWVTPKGDVPTAILKDIPGFAELHDDHLKFCRLFKDLLRDPYLVPLVQVLALFTPDRPNVDDRSAVSDVQDRYICLLKHYLESCCGFTDARRLLPRILSALEELHELAGGHGHLLLHVNPDEVDPLLLEVFDIAKAAAAAAATAAPQGVGVPLFIGHRRPTV